MRRTWMAVAFACALAVAGTAMGQDTIWQIGTNDGAVNPVNGAAEFPATGLYDAAFDYIVGSDPDPAYAPTARGYIGTDNVCAFASDGRPCTDTAQTQNIVFELLCVYTDVSLFYGRYGSEEDVLTLNGEPLDAPIASGEGNFSLNEYELGDLQPGMYVLSINYAGGGDDNGHYIDFLLLEGSQCDCPEEDLCAGQTHDIGQVNVSNDSEYLYVTFSLTEPGWYLEETHVAVAESLDGIPQTKKGNPIPGQFPYACDLFGPGEHTCTATIPLGDWCEGQNLFIAAHAAVVEVEGDGCASPDSIFWATTVEAYEQGTTKGGGDIADARSDENNALGAPDSPQPDLNFFSLGFDTIDDNQPQGWITVGFDEPVYNGPGDDVVVQEVTWGTYPEETADVFGVQNGTDYFSGSVSNNFGADGSGSVDLPDGKSIFEFIKLLDTTNPTPHAGTADAYDLDAVGACYLVVGDETAWGDGCYGDSFDGKSWGTYFTYTISGCAPCLTEECAVFVDTFAAGDSVEGWDAVLPGLSIDAGGEAVAIFAGDNGARVYGAPNNGTCGGSGFPTNGCLDPSGGFSEETTGAHSYTFEFADPVYEFSVRMLDFGDYNPTSALNHEATMTAYYGADVVGTQSLSYETFVAEVNPRSGDYGDMACPVTFPGGTGDACSAEEGMPGNYLWEVASEEGITKVTLVFGVGHDPKIGFDNVCVIR